MRRGLLTAAAVLLWSGTARADLPVIDIAGNTISIQQLGQALKQVAADETKIANQVAAIVQLKMTVDAVMHGDLLALTQLGPELQGLGIGELVDVGAGSGQLLDAVSGVAVATGRLASVTERLVAQDSFYLPPSSADWSASRMVSQARALAAQKALAQMSFDNSAGQITALRATRDKAAKAGDVTTAAQASAVIAGIQAQSQMEGNQLTAAGMLERAQANTTAAQQQQMTRCGYERFAANARAAQAAADAGQIQLITSGAGVGCETAATPDTTAVANTAGTLATTSASASVASGFDQYLGQSVGTGQCVALVQAADPSIGLTATWQQGEAVQGAADLLPGTAIATFDASGRYANATDGSSHAAIYLGQSDTGIQVEDQWLGQPAHIRTIPFTSGGTAANNGSTFYVISRNT